jgi:glycosyltransferase involved in cell wall biosynthesis
MILNAVMCVWNEEDIIESTVKHLLAQGCSNVFIVDNASTDKTVDIAINAGAILIDSFESEYFNEFEKIAHLNTVVRDYNTQSNEDYVWWLYVDADEFPNIEGEIIVNYLNMLDNSIRAVQGYMFNHLPTHPPYHIQGYHPVDFQPLCAKSNIEKIPLLRYDKGKPHLYSSGGAHYFDTCGESISVAKKVLNIHHFNYRKLEDSICRLKNLTTKNKDGISRIDWMDKKEQISKNTSNARSMYHDRYNSIKFMYNQNKYSILMTDYLEYSYKNITRWYDINNLNIEGDTLLGKGIRNYFLKNYDLALFNFNNLLEIINDEKMKLLIFIKFALCLSFTDKTESLNILQPLFKCSDIEISNYAKNCYNVIREDKLSKHQPAKNYI